MLSVPKKVIDRIAQKLRRLQNVVSSCRDRDINESDTVTLVMDILCDLLGFDKYSEITKEFQIRATYCDLAIKLDGKIGCLIECKAIGFALKDQHTQQALNYAANQGCEWVILTNSVFWRVYKVVFGQPITQELVFEIDFLKVNPKSEADVELLFVMSREGMDKNALADYYANLQAKDRYCIAALLMTDGVIKLVRRELRAMNPNVRVGEDEILDVIRLQVLKRELLEGNKATDAQKKIQRILRKREKERSKIDSQSAVGPEGASSLEAPPPSD